MEPFSRHAGRLAVLSQDDVDTDRIIPARFLTRTSKSGYGELLFCDVRGPEFPLDQPAARGASILVVGRNFGCGSSREHAVWAIQQAGFKAVVARREGEAAAYSDIFRQNSANCGLLLAELDAASHDKLVAAGSGAEAALDLPAQTIEAAGETLRFDIDPAAKDALVRGLDLIGTTLVFEPDILAYEQSGNVVLAGGGA